METSQSFGIPAPILTFTVSNCVIVAWEIWVYPIPGELLWWQGQASIPFTGSQFTQAEDTGMGIFTFEGQFDTPSSSRGVLKFPQGFSVFGAILASDVSIAWTASPGK